MTWFRHMLVPLDALARDRRALYVATAAAVLEGAPVTVLPRTGPALQRLRGFADSEQLGLADAAEASSQLEAAIERGDLAPGTRLENEAGLARR
jgi:hypothetical protein